MSTSSSIPSIIDNDIAFPSGGHWNDYVNKAYNANNIDDGDSPYTVTEENGVLLCDTSIADIDVILNAGKTRGFITIKNIGAAGNKVTITPDGAETIEGDASFDIFDGESIRLTWDSTNYWMVL